MLPVRLALEDTILFILSKGPSDQYSIFRKSGSRSVAEVMKVLADMQRHKVVHISGYRKSSRTGQEYPVYSLHRAKTDKLDYHSLIAGVTSERVVEYPFVARNLVQRARKARILEIGSAGSELASAISNLGGNSWSVFGIDLAMYGCDARMDARSLGFQAGVFDQVISISTIEHIGIGRRSEISRGDQIAMKEILRVLRKGGSAIVTVPYGRTLVLGERHRIYDRRSLAELADGFASVRHEFYQYTKGKWLKCTQQVADSRYSEVVPQEFHAAVCACMLLKNTW